MVDRIGKCEYFAPIHNQLDAILDASTFVGRAPQQVRKALFLKEWNLEVKSYEGKKGRKVIQPAETHSIHVFFAFYFFLLLICLAMVCEMRSSNAYQVPALAQNLS